MDILTKIKKMLKKDDEYNELTPKNINELREMTKKKKEIMKETYLRNRRFDIENRILRAMSIGAFSIDYDCEYDSEENEYIINKRSVEFKDECTRQIASELIECGFKVEVLKRETMISLYIDWSNESKEIKEFKNIYVLGE